ncbi:MAG: prolipoprotein diacylglyceryl transferase [Candidatus Gastranaerophilales bacterium]
MIFQSPAKVAFELFGLPIYFYGIILAIAIFVGIYGSYLVYKKFYDSVDAEKILEIAPFVIILGILGARIYYCLLNFNHYFSDPIQILNIREGGLSIHGMIIVGIISLFFFAKSKKISFLKLLDSFSCGVILAQAIGRWGNFFNSEAYGSPTNYFLKLYISPENRLPEFINFEYFHPTFLYESVLNLVVFFILLYLFKKGIKKPGLIACAYLILYSFVRIFIEQIRIDSVMYVASVPVPQLVSFITMIFAIIFAFFIRTKNVD